MPRGGGLEPQQQSESVSFCLSGNRSHRTAFLKTEDIGEGIAKKHSRLANDETESRMHPTPVSSARTLTKQDKRGGFVIGRHVG